MRPWRQVGAAAILLLAVAGAACTDDDVNTTPTPGAKHSADPNTGEAGPAPTTGGEGTPAQTTDAEDHETITAPPPSEIETRYIEALKETGATEVGVAEHGFRNASIGATLQGRYIQLHAYPEEYPEISGAQRTATLKLNGHEVEVWESSSFGESIRLACGNDIVQVSSLDADLGPNSSTREHAEPVAQALIESTCGP